MRDWVKRLGTWFGGNPATPDAGAESVLDASPSLEVQGLIEMVMSTSPDEIGCDEFYEHMDRFVELSLDGQDVAALMPLMQDHLERCRDCHEEYDALRRALQAVA